MKKLGIWITVSEDIDGSHAMATMLHKDRRGRDCIRYGRQWRLVERQRGKNGYRYVIGGTI